MLDTFASGFLVFTYFATALFQLAIVLGAPLGEYAFGGQRTGKLPIGFRIASLVSLLLMLMLAGHFLAQLGALPTLLDPNLNSLANWVVVGFNALSALMNNITKSKKERKLWGGTTIAMLIASIVVVL